MVTKTIIIEGLKTLIFQKAMRMLMMGNFFINIKDIQSSLTNKMTTKLFKTLNYLKTKSLKQ